MNRKITVILIIVTAVGTISKKVKKIFGETGDPKKD